MTPTRPSEPAVNEAAERLRDLFEQAIRYGIDVVPDYLGHKYDDDYIEKPAAEYTERALEILDELAS